MSIIITHPIIVAAVVPVVALALVASAVFQVPIAVLLWVRRVVVVEVAVVLITIIIPQLQAVAVLAAVVVVL